MENRRRDIDIEYTSLGCESLRDDEKSDEVNTKRKAKLESVEKHLYARKKIEKELKTIWIQEEKLNCNFLRFMIKMYLRKIGDTKIDY